MLPRVSTIVHSFVCRREWELQKAVETLRAQQQTEKLRAGILKKTC